MYFHSKFHMIYLCFVCTIMFPTITVIDNLISRHLSKSLLEFLSDPLVLLLFVNEFVLQPVHLLLQFHHGLLSKLSSSLGLLQFGSQCLDLLLVCLLTLIGFLLSNLKRFEIVGHNSQFFFKFNDLSLSDLSPFLSLLQIRLALHQFLGHFIVLCISSLSLLPGFFQISLQLRDSLIIFVGLALENLLGTFRIVRSSGSFVKFSVSGLHFLFSLLQIFLKSRHTSVESVHLQFGCSQRLLFLLQLERDEAKFLSGEVKLSLQLSGLGCQLVHLILTFGSSEPGSLAGLLASIHPITGVVLLHLHGLHLLLDSFHLGED